MPLYDYSCQHCGPFREWNAMSQAGDDVACPTCARPARRLVLAPFLADMNAHVRIAHQRNERSADEPKVMNREQLDKVGTKRSGGHQHHGHHHHRSNRPWMVGH